MENRNTNFIVWFDPTIARIHHLPHSKLAWSQLRHWCGCELLKDYSGQFIRYKPYMHHFTWTDLFSNFSLKYLHNYYQNKNKCLTCLFYLSWCNGIIKEICLTIAFCGFYWEKMYKRADTSLKQGENNYFNKTVRMVMISVKIHLNCFIDFTCDLNLFSVISGLIFFSL
jgi:hypothetical protein